jgi:hypothetical protein
MPRLARLGAAPNLRESVMDRRGVALVLFEETSLKALRDQVRRERTWQTVYRGFRPDGLTREEFARRVAAFASDVRLLGDLCAVFLDDHGTPRGGDLRSRFAELEGRSPSLSDAARTVVQTLAAADLASIPVAAAPTAEEPAGPSEGTNLDPVREAEAGAGEPRSS